MHRYYLCMMQAEMAEGGFSPPGIGKRCSSSTRAAPSFLKLSLILTARHPQLAEHGSVVKAVCLVSRNVISQ